MRDRMSLESKRNALPYGFMRLSDMINLSTIGLGSLCDGLRHECNCLKQAAYGREAWPSNAGNLVDAATKERLNKILCLASVVSDQFEWKAVHDRIARFHKRLDDERTNFAEIYQEVQALSDAVQDGIKWQHLYRYPDDKSKVLLSWEENWAPVTSKFQSIKDDIYAGVDLWALGHSTASVFHMMRVLEHGLKALSNNVGIIYSTQNWYNIINEISSNISEQEKLLPRGDAKAARLQFLSEAAKEFVYFKDGWRNYVSHAKCIYDEHQARSVMEHVRQFMTALSREL